MNLMLFMNCNCLMIRFISPKGVLCLSMVMLMLKLMYFILGNDGNGSGIELLPQFCDEQMCVVTTQVVKDYGDVVVNCIPRVALLMSNTSVFPSVVKVISHLFILQLKVFQTNVALLCLNEFSPLFLTLVVP